MTRYSSICKISKIHNMSYININMLNVLKHFLCIRYIYIPDDSKRPFYPLVGGHLTFEGVTVPSQKGHFESPGVYYIYVVKDVIILPTGSIFTYIQLIFMVNVGKYILQGSYVLYIHVPTICHL